MREIEFRGKRIYDNKWVFGNLVTDKYEEMHIIPEKYFYEDGHHLVYDDGTDRPVFIHQETVGQYTGLKDKSGKKIYEGDIVKNTIGKLEKVVFTSGCFQCASISHPNANLYLLSHYASDIVVIGNIYENPELLD